MASQSNRDVKEALKRSQRKKFLWSPRDIKITPPAKIKPPGRR